ncbi:hypothetical protein, partial [Stenotrophomonas maltophilia]|uniref:hypothetical protein n=1 Tax=Stenotrophomonas maltophilia TaxID=40324 RepID=UPI001C9E3680
MVFIVDYQFQINRILPNMASSAKIACGAGRGARWMGAKGAMPAIARVRPLKVGGRPADRPFGPLKHSGSAFAQMAPCGSASGDSGMSKLSFRQKLWLPLVISLVALTLI